MPDHPFRRSAVVSAAIAVAAVLTGLPAPADETGRTEYMYACSACHGESGLGDGPVARYMNVETPSLTTLAQGNDGVFPLLEVIQVIDGRTGVGPHGTAMPVWGDRFMASEIDDSGRYGAEIIVRGRILSIARFLETIQE
jgi:mono/diheme cytochrome c family protein